MRRPRPLGERVPSVDGDDSAAGALSGVASITSSTRDNSSERAARASGVSAASLMAHLTITVITRIGLAERQLGERRAEQRR